MINNESHQWNRAFDKMNENIVSGYSQKLIQSGKTLIALTKMRMSSSCSSEEMVELNNKIKIINKNLNNYLKYVSSENLSETREFANLTEIFADLEKLGGKVRRASQIIVQKEKLYSAASAEPSMAGHVDKFLAMARTPGLDDRVKRAVLEISDVQREYPFFHANPLVLPNIAHYSNQLKACIEDPNSSEQSKTIAREVFAHCQAIEADVTQALHRQISLLEHIAEKYAQELTDLGKIEEYSFARQSLSEIAQRVPQELVISLQQMLCNPLDWQFNFAYLADGSTISSEALRNFIKELVLKSSSKRFGRFEDFLQEVISSYSPDRTISLNDSIALKRENIREISLRYPKPTDDTPQRLILGRGPGGLIRALKSIQMRQPVTMIERRKESQMSARENIIVMGTLGNGDISLLRHFGITDQLELSNLSGQWMMDGTGLTMSIGALEREMNQALLAINDDQNENLLASLFEASVEDIDLQKGKAIVTVLREGKEPIVFTNPGEIVVAEGARSSTRVLLGIESVPTSKVKHIAVNFFNLTDSSWFSSIAHKITATTSTLPILAGYIADQYVWRKGGDESVTNALMRLGSILLQAPEVDYVYSFLPPALIEDLKQRDAEIKRIEMRIASQEEGSPEEEALEEEKQTLIEQKQRLLGADATRRRNYWDTFYAFMGPRAAEHTMMPAEFERAFTVDVRVAGAGAIGAKIGKNTHVLLIGDALQTTDPIAGAGCSTAIASARMPQLPHSPLAMEMYADCISSFRERMIEEAFERRDAYGIPRTEFLERYTDIAVDGGILTKEDESLLKGLIVRSKNVKDAPKMRFLEPREREGLARIKSTLDEKFLEARCENESRINRSKSLEIMRDEARDELTELKEQYIGHPLHSAERRAARTHASKMVVKRSRHSERNPKGWYLGILLGIDHIEKTLGD